MTGVCFFSFPIIKAMLICSEHINNFWIYRQANQKPQQPAQALFISLHWQAADLGRQRHLHQGRVEDKEKEDEAVPELSALRNTTSHKTTSIQRKMTGALLLLNLGVSMPQSCRVPLAVHHTQFTALSTNIDFMSLLQQIPTCTRPKALLLPFLATKSLAFQGGFLLPFPITFCSISEIPRQGCPSCRAPDVSLPHRSIRLLAQLLLLFCFWWCL